MAGGGGAFDDPSPGSLEAARKVLSVAALYSSIDAVLQEAFPRGEILWVRGEIQKIIQAHSGHCYIDLVDPDSDASGPIPVLSVKCWRDAWRRLSGQLADQGVVLAAGSVVTIRGHLDLYAPRGQVGFVVEEIDVADMLGRQAAARAALIEKLRTEGLLSRNRALGRPLVPLLVGLVASPGTEGYNDFLGQLDGSGFAFRVLVSPTQVQGAAAPQSIASALGALAGAGCDLVALVRGGGSKADLAAFDAEPVARAVAMMEVPVWTGIGHTGDQSVADIVAGMAFITPTECAQAIVGQAAMYWDQVCDSAARIARSASMALEYAGRRVGTSAELLCSHALRRLQSAHDSLVTRRARMTRGALASLEAASDDLVRRAWRLGPLADRQLQLEAQRIEARRKLLAAYDLDRQLARGYTITTDPDGHIIRSATALRGGSVMRTRFADGVVDSTVTKAPGQAAS